MVGYGLPVIQALPQLHSSDQEPWEKETVLQCQLFGSALVPLDF